MEKAKIAVIGGSGLYEIEGLEKTEEIEVDTPFGKPSDLIVLGKLEGVDCAFLPRHGRGHRFLPSEVNYQANIYALKKLGVEQIIAVSACGSLKEEIPPRQIVIPDQLFDRTKTRKQTFFGAGLVAHIGFAEPFCPRLSSLIAEVISSLKIPFSSGGTYVCIEGPQFSTKAESRVNRQAGFSIVGMTAIPEAKLAREAEICYTLMGLVTDYDVWKEGEEVSVELVVENLRANIDNVKKILKEALPKIAQAERTCLCGEALKEAIFTQKEVMEKKTLEKLDLLIRKYLS
jgi:5'-methylthioadenosine phosphorylase